MFLFYQYAYTVTETQFRAELLLGHAYRATHSIIKSQDHYLKAELLARKSSLTPDHELLAFIYQQICTHMTGKNDEALSKLKPLIGNTSLNKFTEGILKQALGNICRSAADWHSAVIYFKESIKLAKDLGDKAREAERKAELGRAYRSAGLYAKALKRQRIYYNFALHRGDMAALALACGYLGFTNYSLNQPDYDTAVVFLSSRLELARQLGDVQGVRWCMNNIGKTYHSLGYHDLTLPLFEKSLELAKDIGDLLGEGTAYGNMGSACRAIGRHKDAIKYHLLYADNAQKRLDTGGLSIMQNELALDYLLLDDLDMARKYAILALQTSLEIRSRLSKEDDLLKIANFEKNQSRTYSLLQFALAEQGLTEAALLVSEMGRARALADLVQVKSHPQDNFLATIANVFDKQGGLALESLSHATREVGCLAAMLCSYLVVYSLVDDPLLQAKGTKQTWLYIWLIAPNKEAADVQFRKVCIGDKKEVEKNLELNEGFFDSMMREIGVEEMQFNNLEAPPESLEDAMASRDLAIVKRKVKCSVQEEKLSRLYHLLFQPIEECISSNGKGQTQRLIFIPQGNLFSVPFPALKGPTRHLVEQFVISISPSLHLLHLVLLKVRDHPKDGDLHALAVGNPQMPLAVIPQLPGSELEAQSVVSILGGKLLTGGEATKEAIKSQLTSYSIVHLATHAILSDSLVDHLSLKSESNPHHDGDYSSKGAIILAKSDSQCSGVLTSAEIQQLALKSKLFVLSCCKTACGKITRDGVLGLSMSILSAGATCVIVTLWSIHDESTADLMKHFYTEYQIHQDAPYALHKAMLVLLARGSSPAKWAAFCILGVSPGLVGNR